MSIDIRILDRHPRIFSIELNRYPGCRSASGSRSISSLAGRADRSRFDEISELPSTKIDLKIHILEFFKYISHIKIYLKNSKKILEKFQNPKYIHLFVFEKLQNQSSYFGRINIRLIPIDSIGRSRESFELS